MAETPLPPADHAYNSGSFAPLWGEAKMRAYAAVVTAAKVAETAALRAELLREHADHKETIEDAAAVARDNTALREQIKVLEDALRGLVGAADDDSAEQWESALDAARAALEQKP